MKLLHTLQERFGFTRSETTVILFLSIAYAAGLCVRWFQEGSPGAGAAFSYHHADSLFHALSQGPDSSSRTKPHDRAPRLAQDSLSPGEVNLNTATADELDRLPGIGPHYAREIVRYREQHGSFRSVDELLEVKGIGPKKLARIRPFVRLH